MNGSNMYPGGGLYPDLAAVLLAGGQSCRMGFDKAFLRVGGKSVAQLLAARLRTLTDQVLLSANDPSAYTPLGLPIVLDIYAGSGPMAGLHAAMLHSQRPLMLVLACDLPRVPAVLLRNIIESSPGFDAVIPITPDGGLHPVCAVYRRTCLPVVERNLRSGMHRMVSLLDEPGLRVRQLTAAEGGFSDTDLLDLNSPDDYEEFRRMSKS